MRRFGNPDSCQSLVPALHVSLTKHHIRELFKLHSTADIVLFAVKQGLISINPE